MLELEGFCHPDSEYYTSLMAIASCGHEIGLEVSSAVPSAFPSHCQQTPTSRGDKIEFIFCGFKPDNSGIHSTHFSAWPPLAPCVLTRGPTPCSSFVKLILPEVRCTLIQSQTSIYEESETIKMCISHFKSSRLDRGKG